MRLYEALDVMNLSSWIMQESFDVESGITCLSWKKNQFEDASLVVGTETGSVQVWSFDGVARIWALDAELDGHERQVNNLCLAQTL